MDYNKKMKVVSFTGDISNFMMQFEIDEKCSNYESLNLKYEYKDCLVMSNYALESSPKDLEETHKDLKFTED